MLQGNWQDRMSRCLEFVEWQLDSLQGLRLLKGIFCFRGIFPEVLTLLLLGYLIFLLALPGTKVSQAAGSTCSLTLGNILRCPVGRSSGLLIDALSVQDAYLLGLHLP